MPTSVTTISRVTYLRFWLWQSFDAYQRRKLELTRPRSSRFRPQTPRTLLLISFLHEICIDHSIGNLEPQPCQSWTFLLGANQLLLRPCQPAGLNDPFLHEAPSMLCVTQYPITEMSAGAWSSPFKLASLGTDSGLSYMFFARGQKAYAT